MYRAAAAILSLLILARAGIAAEPKKPAEPTQEIVTFSLQPMAAPAPALKYQLLPTLEETNPGNAIQGYLKCFMEEGYWFSNPAMVDERDKWSEMPLKELPAERILLQYSRNPLVNIDYAARLDTADWQCLQRLKIEGPATLLPDVTALRELAVTVNVRFRAQVATRHFDDAIASAKTMFAMARHQCVHPTIVGDMCGVAILQMGTSTLEEMVQQRGCPNLYWAISSLPSPMIDIERGLQGEQMMYWTFFAPFDGPTPMTDAELNSAVDRLDASANWFSYENKPKKGDLRKSLETDSKSAAMVAAARKRLIAAGYDEKNISRFLPLQAILAAEIVAFKEMREDDAKAMMLPYWQMEAFRAANREKMQEAQTRCKALVPLFTSMEGPRRSQVRIEQRLALLRCVEALRLYAADHDGQLPASLDSAAVPVPLDAFTGKPFQYRLDGPTAILRGAAPPGKETNPDFNRIYQISMKK